MSRFQLSPIKQIELAAAKIPGAISLAQGIPSFNLHPEIKAFVEERINQGLCDRYSLTNGLQELREEIAIALAADGMQYDPDTEIVATAGSIQAISATLLAITTPGDEVIILSPTYTSYQGVIAMARCTPRFAALDEERNFDLDLDEIEKALTPRTKVIFYCNPNNPTGTIFSEEATRRLAQLAEERNLFIVTDEVYKDFYYVDLPHVTPARYADARKRVIRISSFSKAFSMTGWRIGFLHSDRTITQQILPYHDAMVTCAPVVSQYAAIAAIRAGERIIRPYKEEFRKRRDFVLSQLDRISDLLDYQIPTASYFVFPRIKQTVPKAHDSVTLAYDILQRARLALVPGIAFGPTGQSHLRLSFGRDWPDLEEGCARFEKYMREVTHRPIYSGSEILQKNLPPSEDEGVRSPSISLLKRTFTILIQKAAKLYLQRNPVQIIAIAGLRGKTIFKRVLVDELEKSMSVRGGILSYNTQIGLPLSILNVFSSPGLAAKFQMLAKALVKGVFGKEDSKILILEYGVRSAADSFELLRVARPDYLVLTDITSGEPGIQGTEIFSAIEALVQATNKEKIIWVDSPSLPKEIRGKLPISNRLELSSEEGGLNSHPSDSYALAYAATSHLSSMMMTHQRKENLSSLEAKELETL